MADPRVSPAPDISNSQSDLADCLRIFPLDSIMQEFPTVALIIFNKLSRLARHYVLRLLAVTNQDQSIPEQIVGAWSKNHLEHQKAMDSLEKTFKILIRTSQRGVNLTEPFRLSMQAVHSTGFDTLTISPNRKKPTDEAIDEYAHVRWDNILSILTSIAIAPANSIIPHLLTSCKFKIGNSLSGKGFNFILSPKLNQVWQIVVILLQKYSLQKRAFLSQLAFSTVYRAYKLSAVSDENREILNDFHQLGLVYISEKKDAFYPTSLIKGLLSGDDREDVEPEASGYLVLESNYRLYAYTDNVLNLAILKYFSKLLYKLPGMTVMTITRDTVQEACEKGITAENIITYKVFRKKFFTKIVVIFVSTENVVF